MVLKNMIATARNVFTPNVTRQYPEELMEIPARYRGLHKLDKSKCIGCGICENTCPTRCIEIVRDKRWFPRIDIGHCMFCALCVDQCPTEALVLTKVFCDTVGPDRMNLVFEPSELVSNDKKR